MNDQKLPREVGPLAAGIYALAIGQSLSSKVWTDLQLQQMLDQAWRAARAFGERLEQFDDEQMRARAEQRPVGHGG